MEMSRFDIQKTQRTPEEWSALAFQQTSENNIQWKVAVGVIVAAVATSATSPLTGIAILGWTIFSAIGQAREVQRNQVAIRDIGCVAHVLDGDDFRSYAMQVGTEALNAELAFATQQGYTMSNAALDYLEDISHRQYPINNPQYLPPTQESRASPVDTQEIPSASDWLHSPQPPITNTQSSVHETSNIFDIVSAIASPVQNCIILGVGGSGKGIVTSNSLRRIKANNPNRKIFYIDPKNEPGEYGYLEGVVDVVERKTCKNKSAQEICSWLDKVLDDYIKWENQNEETLLVVDEGMVIGDACKKANNTRIGTIILHIASLGGAAKHNAWLITQTPYVGAMGMNLTQSSQMKWVTLIGANDMGVLKQWSKSANLENISLDRLGALTQESPVKRAVYWGGHSKWYALPQYPNYSTIDRDNDKPNGDALSSAERQQLRERTQTQKIIELLERTKHLNLDDFIIEELGEGDRLSQVKQAIIKVIHESKHYGLSYKFKLD